MQALIDKLVKGLNGWKTEIGIVAYLIVRILTKCDVLDGPDYPLVYDLIASWTGVALKDAVRKSSTKTTS